MGSTPAALPAALVRSLTPWPAGTGWLASPVSGSLTTESAHSGGGGLFSGVQADHNAGRGMVLQFTVIANSEANDNGDIGIWALDSSVAATTAKRNASDGFMLVGDINLIDDRTASGNGSADADSAGAFRRRHSDKFRHP